MMSKKLAIAAVVIAAAMITADVVYDTLIDPRDNQTYRTVRIGNLTWMAENLNYRTKDSWCYDNADSKRF